MGFLGGLFGGFGGGGPSVTLPVSPPPSQFPMPFNRGPAVPTPPMGGGLPFQQGPAVPFNPMSGKDQSRLLPGIPTPQVGPVPSKIMGQQIMPGMLMDQGPSAADLTKVAMPATEAPPRPAPKPAVPPAVSDNNPSTWDTQVQRAGFMPNMMDLLKGMTGAGGSGGMFDRLLDAARSRASREPVADASRGSSFRPYGY